MNIIWNAAQDYEWVSPFLAFHPNGEPDDYMNMVIGLSAKWLDAGRITDFFEALSAWSANDEASSLMWLGIENCVYGKEVEQRPHLAQMRRERAEEFFRVNGMLSEQQMAFMSIRVYDQELIRWSNVLGRRHLVPGKGAADLASRLEFSPGLDTDGVLSSMDAILDDTFHITLSDRPRGARARGHGLFGRLAGAFSGSGSRPGLQDLLVLRKGSGSGDARRSVHITHDFGASSGTGDAAGRRDYIEESFGPCMYTDEEMRILEKNLCTGHDASCRLWFTNNIKDAKHLKDVKPLSPEAKKLMSDRLAQRKRNEDYYAKNVFRIRESIRNLSAQADTVFQSYLRYLPARSRAGRLETPRAWRLACVSDNQVFLKDSDLDEATVRVELLLDASQSRMNSQEMIAAQALIISRSFEQCHIPVRVTAFRSLSGYTILERLKEFGDRRGEGIFGYYAGGWNRDALCLKAMEYQMRDEMKNERHQTRILMVLTDASPNDSVPLEPKNGRGLRREYEGDEPVRDAQEAVRMLRSGGVHTCAMFYGSTAHLDQVHQIYGQQYVRVKTLSQLSDAVCTLLERSLREWYTK